LIRPDSDFSEVKELDWIVKNPLEGIMVLLAAAVVTKGGKSLVSRQFVEMTRPRIEGLLASFPKLISAGKQHTFVETESVRYVYQPLENLYMVLITTKASNILEDLETLRLFSRVIPEYCKLEESDVSEHAFDLIFAFDEIIALGYRENVNLAQIKTFTEMDSHEEKVFQAVRQTQEREAKDAAKRKAKELEQMRREAARKGQKPPGFGGHGSSASSVSSSPFESKTESKPVSIAEPSVPSVPRPKPASSRNAMKLGSKSKDVDSFVDQLKSEGQAVIETKTAVTSKSSTPSVPTTPVIPTEPVHIRIEEKTILTAGREGGLQSMEVLGMLSLRISDINCSKLKILMNNDSDKQGVQVQTHPNIDKKMFISHSQIGLKQTKNKFPLNDNIGVLKWRLQTTDETMIPLSINCWPSENGDGGLDVSCEFELEKDDMELNDVKIQIPLPAGCGPPIVNDCDGVYQHDKKGVFDWHLTIVDAKNKTGTLEFSLPSARSSGIVADDLFPIKVSYTSPRTYCDISVAEVVGLDEEGNTSGPIKFSKEMAVWAEKYEIV